MRARVLPCTGRAAQVRDRGPGEVPVLPVRRHCRERERQGLPLRESRLHEGAHTQNR
jgi:hypothetical protein